MAIDYSKWDKIELSDDSDIEVHPNVDKNSFIRWKQQDIHQKRDQRNHDITNLEVQIPMYEELNKRTDKLLKDIDNDKLADYSYIQEYLKTNFDSTSKPDGVEPDAPTHNEMIEDLFTQLKKDLEKARRDPNDGELLRAEIVNHRKKIDEVLFNHKDKLKSLLKERELHISSDDIHTGWDRSFLNKGAPAPAPTTNPLTSSTATTSTAATSAAPVATSHTSTSATSTLVTKTEPVEETLGDLHKDTIDYSNLSTTDITKIKSFLKEHTHIINPQQKDSLLMKAFDSQLELNPKRTKQIVFLSTLLQYIYDIIEFKRTKHPTEIGIIIDQLLGKMFNGLPNPALEAFENEVERTFQHIKQRCEVISLENDGGEQVEEIQLKSLDDNTELVVNLPDGNSKEESEIRRFEIFQTLPIAMQDALKTGKLDEVNKVFHNTPIDEAEQILEVFEECEVIGVQAVIENEEDWKEIKSEYQAQFTDEKLKPSDYKNQETPKIEELEIKSNDIVD